MFSNAVPGGRFEVAASVGSGPTGGSSTPAKATGLGVGATAPCCTELVVASEVSSGTSGLPSGAGVAGTVMFLEVCFEKAVVAIKSRCARLIANV